LTAAAAAVGM